MKINNIIDHHIVQIFQKILTLFDLNLVKQKCKPMMIKSVKRINISAKRNKT